MSIARVAFRPQRRRHAGRDRSAISSTTFSATPRSARSAIAYVVDPKRPGAGELGQGTRRSARISRSCRRSPPRSATGARAGLGHRHRRPGGADRRERGAEARLARVLRAADRAGAGADPRPAGAHRAADRRSASLVAILAGIVLARRMLIPITALRTGARRLGAGDFGHRIEVHTRDELEELADAVQQHGGPAAGDLCRTSKPRWRSARGISAQSINELKVLEEVGRAVASSLDLNAVLPTVAARALEITHADAVLIYGYDAATPHASTSTEVDRHRQGQAEGDHLVDRRGRQRARARPPPAASRSRSPISTRAPRHSAARCRCRRRLPLGAGGAAGRPDRAFWARWWCCAKTPATFSAEPDRADEDLRAPIGAGDAQCAAVSAKSTTRAANSRPRTPPCSSRRRSCRSRPTS